MATLPPVPAQWNAVQWNEALFGGGAAPPGLVTQVGKSLLYPALRKAAITLGPQRTPSPAQYQDAIEELNRLVGSLSCDRFFIYSVARTEYLLTGAGTYTIGIDPSGQTFANFQSPRPQMIESANIISGVPPSSIRYPLKIIDHLQWAKIGFQDLPNTIPEKLYNDRAYPISTLYLWGQPMAGSLLELFAWQLVPEFQAVGDVVLLPPGYEDALVLNLACRMAPHFQRQVHPDVRQQARESLARLESINAPQPIASVGFGCSGDYDIYSDQKINNR